MGAHGEVEARCSFYLAKSTIEGAGLGVFTGVPFEKGAHIGFSDPAIPIFDIDFHAGGSRAKEDYHWLMDEYIWLPSETGAEMVLEADDLDAFVTGIGSVPNCHLRLNNVREGPAIHDTAGITRSDPGAGASTPYHNRSTHTLRSLEAGQEIFVSYGVNWFLSRESYMGLIPLKDSFRKATKFMESFEHMVQKNTILLQDDLGDDSCLSDLWGLIQESAYKSRPLSAVPKVFSVARRALEVGIEQTEVEQSVRSLNYLENQGKCLDNIRPAISSIPMAGRGAFATRFIPKGGYVSIAPLIHIPDRDVLIMYADKYDPVTGEGIRDLTNPTGYQLLLNYCFGHKSSSMLLCPNLGSYINHNSDSPNVKLEWSTDPTYHNASWMDEPIAFFDNIWRVGLAFEVIALKDIKEGDEITVDYGPEWEDAWIKHIRLWEPPEDAKTYTLHHRLNQDLSLPIPTYDEDHTLITEHIEARFHEDKIIWRKHDLKRGRDYSVLRVISRTQLPTDNSLVYSVVLSIETDGGESIEYTVENVTRNALSFYHVKKYRSDIFIDGVFRHEIMIPDRLFPNAWKNLLN